MKQKKQSQAMFKIATKYYVWHTVTTALLCKSRISLESGALVPSIISVIYANSYELVTLKDLYLFKLKKKKN